ncbi:MAG: SDR family oxidoreductase [Bacteroidaceae bacterium]|nr:SDR family oxidoreductase [Bacteroidaceae bacterium]MBR5456788.1 SDR family oxidoreductase [Bacteroidaceae bacterium]
MKTAIVTGGTSGIGLGVAHMLIEKGYRVYATYAHNAPTSSTDNYKAIKVDQSNRDELYSFISHIKESCSTIDCIVCNAGTTARKPFTCTTDSDWDNMMEIAVNSHYILIRELYSLIPPGSRILFTGSQMGITPHATVLGYGVTKAAVHALAKGLVKEFEGTGTTVNAIAPGFVETPWHKDKPSEIRGNICNKTAIHRFATVAEVVDAYRFCIDNPFVNGSIIEVNGGYSYK